MLIRENPAEVFDMSQIRRGDLLWGKHCTWDEGKAGFVTAATESQLVVQYFPGIGNVTNHFFIPVAEVAAGQWEIRWSSDMSEIQEYGISKDGDVQPEEPGETPEPGGEPVPEEPEPGENPDMETEPDAAERGDEENDTGGTDL